MKNRIDLRHPQVRYDGRTVVLHFAVNTTEDAEELAGRVHRFISDSGIKPMVTGGSNLLPPDEARAFWEEVISAAVKEAGH